MIQSATYYTAQCDNCNKFIELECGGFQCFTSEEEAKEIMRDCEWIRAEDEPESKLPPGTIYCPDCLRRNDEDLYEIIPLTETPLP